MIANNYVIELLPVLNGFLGRRIHFHLSIESALTLLSLMFSESNVSRHTDEASIKSFRRDLNPQPHVSLSGATLGG